MVTRDDIIREARALIGVPFLHQGRDRVLGLDCVGVLAAVADALEIPHSDDLTYELRANDSGVLRRVLIESACVEVPIDLSRHGDILTFWYERKGCEYHAGFLATDRGRPTVIHALPHPGTREVTLSDRWRSRMIAQFTPPGFPAEVAA